MTLRKIDEIEAQMSMQWCKTQGPDSLPMGDHVNGKHRTLDAGSSTRQQLAPLVKKPPEPPKPQRREQPKPPEFVVSEPPVVPFVPTMPASGALDLPPPAPPRSSRSAPQASEPPAQAPAVSAPSFARTGLMAPRAQREVQRPHSIFSATHFYALEVHEVVQDPQVEEAAIRFANGDDAGAEQGLLEALDERGVRAQSQEDWLALFDLYRATGQLASFESYAVDFANRFSRSAPQWFDMPKMVGQLSGKRPKPAATSDQAIWVCDPLIDSHAVGTLQRVLSDARLPWTLDWSRVESIDVKAARGLLGMFTLWGDQDVMLRFVGASALCDLLKKLTPSGRRDVEQLWWELRMAVLRVMNKPQEFELIALDFCVTYEVSPPDWEEPVCRFQALSDPDAAGGNPSVLGELVLEHTPASPAHDLGTPGLASDPNNLGLVELSGEIRGEPEGTLAALDQRLDGSDVLIISCRNLIRVDFSAAGALLNWVSGHHSQGREVQFVDAHRLVSAFFHVIGITEYAKVVLRND